MRPGVAGVTTMLLAAAVVVMGDGVGVERVATSAPAQAVVVECHATVHEPHFSKGAGGAIFKTSVTCRGSGVPEVQVRVRGYLSFAPTPSGERTGRASSDETQSVALNGPPVVFYTPKVGSNGGRGNGAWFATATAQAVAPVVSNIADDTYAVQKNI